MRASVATHTALEGARRFRGGQRRAAVDTPYDRGLLPRDVRALCVYDVQAQVERTLGERPPDSLFGGGIGQVHEAALGAGHGRGQPESVQDRVRPVPQQPAVLDGTRLALLTVGDDDGRARCVAHGAQLYGGGETGPAPAPQSRGGDPVEQPVGRGQRRVAVCAEIPGEIAGPGRPGGEEALPSFGEEGEHGGHMVLLGSEWPESADAEGDLRRANARSRSRRCVAVRS